MKSKQFTTYRKENLETLRFEEELKNSSSFDERKQFNKKDLVFEDTRLVNEETKQLVTKIL